MNPSRWAKFLRNPPKLLVALAKALVPSHKIRRGLFDPIRKPGFKPKANPRPKLTEQQRTTLDEAFATDIEFIENLETHIDSNLIISH